MDIHCKNAGMTSTNMVGDLPVYGTVWYHAAEIANILSLATVQEHGYHITYDSRESNKLTIYKPDGTMRVFKQSYCGLYFMDIVRMRQRLLWLIRYTITVQTISIVTTLAHY